MKKLIAVLMAALLMLAVVACAAPTEPAPADPVDSSAPTDGATTPEAPVSDLPEELTFAIIYPASDANWYNSIAAGFEYGAKEAEEALGIKINTMLLPSDYDVDLEIANIEMCVTQDIDGLCMYSFNESGAGLAAKKLADTDIHLVCADSCGQGLEAGYDMDACVDFDWYKMGVDYATWMAENTTGDYVIITGNFESYPCQFVNEAMQKTSEELGVNALVGPILDSDYEADKAAAIAEDLINSGKDFETIFAMCADLAVPVCRVLDAAGYLNNPYKVITQNGQDDLDIAAVADGRMQMTISSSPGYEGYVSFRCLLSERLGKADFTNEQIWLPCAVVDFEATQNRDNTVIVPWDPCAEWADLAVRDVPVLDWYNK